jgi:formylglycine-generating enzyme required for sulfatase activity
LRGSATGEAGRDADETQQQVTLTRGFFIAVSETTQREWDRVFGAGAAARTLRTAKAKPSTVSPELPMHSVTWEQATEYCRRLSELDGMAFRLPTEAEWEHAATGGGSPFLPGELEDVAWFAGNSNGAPQRVGTKVPGAWGLRDMLGNVQEWCVAQDGAGVTRGGSYRDGPEKVNTTHREPYNRAWNASDPQIPKSRWWLADGPFVGFRVVCEVE